MDARPARIDALQYLQCMQSLILHFLNVYQRMTGTTILAMRWTMGTAFWTHIKLKQLNGMSNNLAFVGTWTWWSAKKQPGYTGLGPSNPPLHVWYIRRANHSLAHPRRLNYTVMIADYFWTNHHCHHTGLYNSGSMSCGPGRHLESAMLDNTSNHGGMVQLDRYTLRYDLHFQVWRHWKWISMVLPSASNFEQLSEFNEIKDIKGSYLPRLNSLLLQQFAAEHAT